MEFSATSESELIRLLNSSQSFVLSTHKNSDGDGIGSAVALFWGLQQRGKTCAFYHVDALPTRYNFLTEKTQAHLFQASQHSALTADTLIVTDTNQGSLCDPLYSHFKSQNKKIIFIDHHIPSSSQNNGEIFYIHTQASSTGEVVYDILKTLNVEITGAIATALYTSITFDTQAFKLLRNSSRSHEIAALLSRGDIETDKIQRELFATWTIQKMNFLSNLIKSTKYAQDNTVAGFTVTQDELKKYELQLDHINDILDMFTLIKSIHFCYSIIEIAPNKHKVSFRSIGSNKAFVLAEKFGGGGHAKSAGAWVENISAAEIEKKILTSF